MGGQEGGGVWAGRAPSPGMHPAPFPGHQSTLFLDAAGDTAAMPGWPDTGVMGDGLPMQTMLTDGMSAMSLHGGSPLPPPPMHPVPHIPPMQTHPPQPPPPPPPAWSSEQARLETLGLAERMRQVADAMEAGIHEQLTEQDRAMEVLVRLTPEVEHQLDKVAALEELCRLHDHELPLAQALGATIRQQLGQRQ